MSKETNCSADPTAVNKGTALKQWFWIKTRYLHTSYFFIRFLTFTKTYVKCFRSLRIIRIISTFYIRGVTFFHIQVIRSLKGQNQLHQNKTFHPFLYKKSTETDRYRVVLRPILIPVDIFGSILKVNIDFSSSILHAKMKQQWKKCHLSLNLNIKGNISKQQKKTTVDGM